MTWCSGGPGLIILELWGIQFGKQRCQEALEKKEQRWKSMKAEDAEREFFWWLAGATFLQLGTWTAGFSYAEILWMQQVNFS